MNSDIASNEDRQIFSCFVDSDITTFTPVVKR